MSYEVIITVLCYRYCIILNFISFYQERLRYCYGDVLMRHKVLTKVYSLSFDVKFVFLSLFPGHILNIH